MAAVVATPTPFHELFWGEDARGYDVLTEKFRKSNDVTKELLTYMNEKASLAGYFIKSLTKLNDTFLLKSEEGTLGLAIAELQSITAAEIKYLQESVQHGIDLVLTPLAEFRANLKKEHAKNDEAYKNAVKALNKEVSNVDKIRQVYVTRAKERDKAREVADRGQQANMTKKDYIKICEKAIKCDKELNLIEMDYHKAVADWTKMRGKWEEAMRSFAKQTEKLEEERINLTKRVLTDFGAAQSEDVKNIILVSLQKFAQTAVAVDAAADLATFAQANSTGGETAKPPVVYFRHYATNQPVSLLDPVQPKDKKLVEAVKTMLTDSDQQAEDAPINAGISRTGSSLGLLNFGKRKSGNSSGTIRRPVAQKTSLDGGDLPNEEGNGEESTGEIKASDQKPAPAVQEEQTEPFPEAVVQNSVEPPQSVSPPVSPVNTSKPSTVKSTPLPTKINTEKSPEKSSQEFSDDEITKTISPRLEERLKTMEKMGITPRTSSSNGSASSPLSATASITISTPLKESSSSSPTGDNRSRRQSVSLKMNRNSVNLSIPVSEPPPTAGSPNRFSRRSIKMEGWLVYFDNETENWSRHWVALEGGYLWFFDQPSDNEKPPGLNKPRSMTPVKGALAEKGHTRFDGDIGEDVVSSMPYLFTITELPKKSQLLCSAGSAQERDEWVASIAKLSKRGENTASVNLSNPA